MRVGERALSFNEDGETVKPALRHILDGAST